MAGGATLTAAGAPTRSSGEIGRARARRERAARRFRPLRVDLLLVGEAPPTTLDRYFYFPDVREHDSLFRYVASSLLGLAPTRENKADLLEALQERGVFFIDLNEEPFDDRPLSSFVPGLIARIRRLDPAWIVLIKVDVFDAAYEPLREAGLPVSSVRVPFPGSGQQRRFEEAFALALRQGAEALSARAAGTAS